MNYFTAIDEGFAIIRNRGVYRQAPLYEREGKIYAKHGSGFIRLLQNNGTTVPTIKWNEIDTPHGSYTADMGGLSYTPNQKARAA